MTKGYRFTGLLVCAMTVALWGQQAVAPPPRPTDGGPDLPATMNFLKDKVGSLGTVSYAIYLHDNEVGNDWIAKRSIEITDVNADVDACRLTFHFKETTNGTVSRDINAGVPFRQAEDVVVMPLDDSLKEANVKAGHVTWTAKTDPAVYVLRVRRRNNGGNNEFDFPDATLADRVAKAMTHAIELCGGGNKDVF